MPTPPENDELTDARQRLAGVLAKLAAATDPDDIAYYQRVAVEWRAYIKRLEDKHGRETTVQTKH